ncbi:MAG: outer membrane protein assembly factor BamA, partial [Bacteroidota bacterium]
MLKIKLVLFFLPLIVSTCFAQSQVELIRLNYTEPEKFEIAEITVSGTQFLDPAALISVSGLKVGDIIKIPGDALSNAINKLWDQGILGNVDIAITKAEGRFIHLDFHLTERPRLSKFNFNGIKKGDADELKEKIRLVKGKVLTDAMLKVIQNKVKDFYAEKGFLNTAVAIQQVKDTTFSNSVV